MSALTPPRVVAWELTRACPMACRHCRADAAAGPSADELTTAEGLALIDDLAAAGTRLLILTGGEPMLRDDLGRFAAHATAAGIRAVAAVCGSLIDTAAVSELRAAGIAALSLSIDGADAATHDALRGRAGAFARVCTAVRAARAGGMPVQINTTVHRGNRDQLAAIQALATDLDATTWDLFLLVPTGRGRALAAEALAPADYDAVLHWAADQAAAGGRPQLKVTCAPRYVPIAAAHGVEGRGCLGGRSFAFVGADGAVQMCGFVPVACGNVRAAPFATIWREAPFWRTVRDPAALTGACGACAHRSGCGGCRARALAATGDVRGADPCCPLAAETA